MISNEAPLTPSLTDAMMPHENDKKGSRFIKVDCILEGGYFRVPPVGGDCSVQFHLFLLLLKVETCI